MYFALPNIYRALISMYVMQEQIGQLICWHHDSNFTELFLTFQQVNRLWGPQKLACHNP